MRYELDSVRAHEVVLAGLDTKYPYAPRSSVPVAMPVAVPAGIQPFPPPSRPSTSSSQPFHQPFHHGVYAFDTQRATHEAWMAQQRAWIAAGVPPPPADFMPFPGMTSLGDPPAIHSVDTKDPDAAVDTQTPEPEDGLEGVEAKMAADDLMSAALAMAGAGVHTRKSTAAIRKEVRLFLITLVLARAIRLTGTCFVHRRRGRSWRRRRRRLARICPMTPSTTAWTTSTTWTSYPRVGEESTDCLLPWIPRTDRRAPG
jgi:hypothetical protein